MNKSDLLTTVSYLEFVNNVDNLVFDLLYSSKDGYTGLLSKNAVMSAKDYFERFNHEAEKLKKNIDFDCADKIIDEKRNNLIKQMKKHYDTQILSWADEVYQNVLESCFLQAAVFKDDKNMCDKIYAKILSCISWICNVHNYSDDKMSRMISLNINKFNDALNTQDKDYIPKVPLQKTNPAFYLELRSLILTDKDKFLSVDFNSLDEKLNSEDIQQFNRIKRDIQTSKVNSIKDDILLINSAIDVLKIKKDEDKYNFIKLIRNDFSNFNDEKLDEEGKIEIIKRRMQLFKNSLNNDAVSDYFKSKITS